MKTPTYCRPHVRRTAAALATGAAILLIALVAPARGQVSDWVGAMGDWSNPGNWDNGVPSGPNGMAFIANGGTAQISSVEPGCYRIDLGVYNGGVDTSSGALVMTAGGINVADDFNVGYNYPGTFTQSGGSVTFASSGYGVTVCAGGAAGTYSLSGNGYLSATLLNVGYFGNATFSQSGGTNATAQVLVTSVSGYSGMYSLSGTGYLTTNVLGVGGSGATSFAQSGGSVVLYNNGSIHGCLNLCSNTASTGSCTLSNGLLSAPQEWLGINGSGTFTQSGGTNSVPQSSNYGPQFTLGEWSGSSGSYFLNSSGLLLAPNGETIGSSGGTGSFTQTGGTNTIAGTNSGCWLRLGNSSGGAGMYTLDGPGQLSAPAEYVGVSGTGIFTHSAGTNTIDGPLYVSYGSGTGSYNLSGNGYLSAQSESVGFQGTGTFTQSGGTNSVAGALSLSGAPGTSGTYNLNAGTLVVSQISLAAGTAAMSLDGGTLRASAPFSTAVPITLGTGGGGATIDNGGYAVTFSGAISGTGGFTAAGTGTITLIATNTYSGGTTVSQGKLVVAGSLAKTAVTVEGGASLGGTGSIGGSVTVAGGSGPGTWGTINLVDGAARTLTLSDAISTDTVLTIGGSAPGSMSLLNFEVGATADRIVIAAGKLLVNPGGGIINITPLAGFGPGIYDLMDFPSGQASGLDNLSLTSTSIPGYVLSLQSAGNAERLVVSSVPEPSTLMMLCVAAGALSSRVRRRRTKVA